METSRETGCAAWERAISSLRQRSGSSPGSAPTTREVGVSGEAASMPTAMPTSSVKPHPQRGGNEPHKVARDYRHLCALGVRSISRQPHHMDHVLGDGVLKKVGMSAGREAGPIPTYPPTDLPTYSITKTIFLFRGSVVSPAYNLLISSINCRSVVCM